MKVKTNIRKIVTKIVTYYVDDIGVEIEFSIQDGIFNISQDDIWTFRNNEELDFEYEKSNLSEKIYDKLKFYNDKKISITEMNNLIKKVKKIIKENLTSE